MFSLKLALVRSLVEYLQQFLIPVIRKKDMGRGKHIRDKSENSMRMIIRHDL